MKYVAMIFLHKKYRYKFNFQKDNNYHRTNGHAIEMSDSSCYKNRKIWYIEGKPYRDDGPVIEDPNGDKYWYIENRLCAEKEFNEYLLSKQIKTL